MCAYCHDALSPATARYCAACLTPQHPECAAEHGRCVSLGCGETRTVGAVGRGWSGWTVLAAVGLTTALLLPLGWLSETGRVPTPHLSAAPPPRGPTPLTQVSSVYDYEPDASDPLGFEPASEAKANPTPLDSVAAARAFAHEHVRGGMELAEGAFARGEAASALNLLSNLHLPCGEIFDDELEMQLEARIELIQAVYGRWQRSQALGVRSEALKPLAEILELLADQPENHYYGAAKLMHAHVALHTR